MESPLKHALGFRGRDDGKLDLVNKEIVSAILEAVLDYNNSGLDESRGRACANVLNCRTLLSLIHI